jgi:hypothetical protein
MRGSLSELRLALRGLESEWMSGILSCGGIINRGEGRSGDESVLCSQDPTGPLIIMSLFRGDFRLSVMGIITLEQKGVCTRCSIASV